MKHVNYLSMMIDRDLTKSFRAWCRAVGYTESEGEQALLNLPDRAALALLRCY